MSTILGYIEIWSYYTEYATITPTDITYLHPYTNLVFSFIVLFSSPGDGKPAPVGVTFDGSFYYGGQAIITNGQKNTSAARALEFWDIYSKWAKTIHSLGKKFHVSIGGWADIQSTPELGTHYADIQTFLSNIHALATTETINGLDCDWEHLGAVVNGSDPPTQLDQQITLEKTMFLGYLLASIKNVYPQWLISYTTRSNTFYPFLHESGSQWLSDREGVGVAFGIYLYSKIPVPTWTDSAALMTAITSLLSPLNFQVNDILRSYAALPLPVVTALSTTLSFVNIMSYDGPVGKLSKNGCYTIDDYSTLLTQTMSVMNYPSLLLLGFEPLKQAITCAATTFPVCSSFCELNNSVEGGVTLSLTETVMEPVFQLMKQYKIGGLLIWGTNDFNDFSNSNECAKQSTGKCMSDYSLTLANAYAKFISSPTFDCAWYQTRNTTGACLDPLCNFPRFREENEAGSSSFRGIKLVGLVLAGIGFVLITVFTLYKNSISFGFFMIPSLFIAMGFILVLFGRSQAPPQSEPLYQCDAQKGCIPAPTGTIFDACARSCQAVTSYDYKPATNSCVPVTSYGRPLTPYSSQMMCERSLAKYSCTASGCVLSTEAGSSDYASCATHCNPSQSVYTCSADPSNQCIVDNIHGTLTQEECSAMGITYTRNADSLTCSASCTSGAIVTKEACEASVPYKCVNGECVAALDGPFVGAADCSCEPSITCDSGTIARKDPSGVYKCVPCEYQRPYALGIKCNLPGDCLSNYCQAVNCDDSSDAHLIQYNHDARLCRSSANDLHCYSES